VVQERPGNFLVTVIKFVAFFLSGSGAMLSEAIHSTADTGNGPDGLPALVVNGLGFSGLRVARACAEDAGPTRGGGRG
jgi:hypothetical protein